MPNRLKGETRRKTLLNYTTTVDAAKTITEIQQLLAAKGALAVTVEYDSTGFPSAVTFAIMLDNHRVTYRLPSKYDEALKAMQQAPDVPHRYCNRDQAIRTCWRILKDWAEAQLALVQLKQVELAEVFFPYAVDASSGMTLFEHWRESQKLLAEGEGASPLELTN